MILWSPPFSPVLRTIDMSNSPHPSSVIRNGGVLKAGMLSDQPVALKEQEQVTLLRTISERLVQVVGDFVEDSGRNLFAVFVQ